MSAYFIVSTHLDDRDRSGYDEYIDRVRPIVERLGGEYLVRTNEVTAWSERWKPDRVIVIRFDSREALERCFSSPEYTAIKGLREGSVDARAIIVEGTPD